MKIEPRVILSISLAGILTLACSLLTTPAAPPTAIPPAVQVEPAAQPATEPASPPTTISNLQAGFAAITGQTISFYNLNGAQVSQVVLSQLSYPQRSRLHIAGPLPQSGESVPLLYFSFDNQESLHFRDGNGQIFALLNGASFLGLTGVPAQPLVAFSQIEYLETSLRSKLYAGSIQSLPSAAPVSVIDDPEAWAIKPILLDAENGVPTRIWYTRVAYGIGGDIVFEPRKGLFAFDLATGQTQTILDDSLSPWSVSNDRNWVAYSSDLLPPNPICVKSLASGGNVCIPQLPASESRGTGEAFLSPDASYVTWMEGNGWLMAELPNFTTTVRVARADGTVVADLPMAVFETTAGIGPLSRAEPEGWLDNQTVVIQVRGQEWEQAALLRYDIASNTASYLAPGEFAGLVYP